MNNRYRDHIIINALMRGGILPPGVKEELFDQWGEVGYALCHDCLEGRSSLCGRPPVKKHLERVAAFYGGDAAEHTFGCRTAKFAVMRAVREWLDANPERTDTIVVDANSHYSTNIAAELNSLRVAEVPHNGYPTYSMNAAGYEEKILEIKRETGRLPALAVATHADPYYGNLAPVEDIGRICRELDVPFLVNAAYTGGVIPIDMRAMNADFLSVSAHKSMASLAPLGCVITTHEWSGRVFATSAQRTQWSGRVFGKKIPNIFGCSIGGIPAISGMLSMDHVEERVTQWDREIESINAFARAMEEIPDIMLLGQRPHRHHLLHFETPGLWEALKQQGKNGFYLSEFMIKNGVVGLHRGMSKHIKFSVYGLSQVERDAVLNLFREIAGAKVPAGKE